MRAENAPFPGPLLLAFLAGATLGALAAALTTPKTGPDLRADLKALARRAKRRTGALAEDASDAWDDLKHRALMAATDLKQGVSASVDDLRGKPSGNRPTPPNTHLNEAKT